MSTGIGPDNIDIVMNELDALVNIDLKTRTVKERINVFKYSTCWNLGSLQADIPVDSMVMSAYGLGLDNMLRSYLIESISEKRDGRSIYRTNKLGFKERASHVIAGSNALIKKFESNQIFKGFTGTAGGFMDHKVVFYV